MKKEEMVKTDEFKELVKQFMIEEAYGACDIKLHYEQFGLKFKPRASDEEISARIDYFVERVYNGFAAMQCAGLRDASVSHVAKAGTK